MKTVAQALTKKRLLSTSAPSRETRREQASLFEARGARKAKQREAATDEQHQDNEDKDAARRIVGKTRALT